MPFQVIKSEKPRGWFVVNSETKKKYSIKPFKRN